MSAFKGTPGPWTATDYVNDSNLYVCENGSNPIIEVYRARYEKDGADRAKANAALSAQAPAMLQIVTALLNTEAPRAARVDLAMILAREVHAALREGGAL